MAMKRYSPKLQNWTLTIRWLSIKSRTTVGCGEVMQRCSRHILQSKPTRLYFKVYLLFRVKYLVRYNHFYFLRHHCLVCLIFWVYSINRCYFRAVVKIPDWSLYVNTSVGGSIYSNLPTYARCDTRSFLTEYSWFEICVFFLLDRLPYPKPKNQSAQQFIHNYGEEKNQMSFSRVLVLSETQIDLIRIWSQVTNSTSSDDNRYANWVLLLEKPWFQKVSCSSTQVFWIIYHTSHQRTNMAQGRF